VHAGCDEARLGPGVPGQGDCLAVLEEARALGLGTPFVLVAGAAGGGLRREVERHQARLVEVAGRAGDLSGLLRVPGGS
jgi:hypothetical protein